MRRSALYEGRVWHSRRGPRAHRFGYRLYLAYLDLEELPALFEGRSLWSVEKPNVMSFRRADYLGGSDEPQLPLDEAIRERVEAALDFRPRGPVRVLTQLRSFGFVFNPVSFYYCFAEDGESLQSIVAEITNTPWGERHAYVLDARPGGFQDDRTGGRRWLFEKAFHVSPFFDMDHEYAWRFTVPGERLSVLMQNRQGGEEEPVFEAGLELQRCPLDDRHLRRALLRHPLMSLKVVAGIYWQALRLWLKRTPFYTHPSKRSTPIR